MSTRVDSSSLISGAVVVGVPGLGVLAENIPSTGDHGPGYAYDSLEFPADNGKEIRGLITTWPTLGTLTAFEDTSFEYDGASDTFAFQLYVDGVAVGSPQTVTLTIGATAITLDADPAAYSVTAADSAGTATRELVADHASYALTATDATLTHVAAARVLAADPAAYALTADPAALVSARRLSATPAAYTLSAADSAAVIARGINAQPAQYAVTTADATLDYATPNRVLAADPSSIVIAASPATLIVNRALAAGASAYSLTSSDAVVSLERTLQAAPGAYDILAADAGLTVATPNPTLRADPATYVLAGSPAALLWSSASKSGLRKSVFVRVEQFMAFARVETPQVFTRV